MPKMDLVLRKIADASLADKERVIIKVLKTCNLNRYILFDTTYDENGIRSDKHRHVYVFPNLIVNEGDFIWLYTKKVLIMLMIIRVELKHIIYI